MDWMFMSPLKFIYWNSNHQCGNMRRWGLWKVIRIRWSYEGGILKNVILTGITRKIASLFHSLPLKNTIPSPPPPHNLFFYLIIAVWLPWLKSHAIFSLKTTFFTWILIEPRRILSVIYNEDQLWFGNFFWLKTTTTTTKKPFHSPLSA